MAILNLTQHTASEEQINAGVLDVDTLISRTVKLIEDTDGDVNSYLTVAPTYEIIKKLLTFESLPTKTEINDRAEALAKCVNLLGLRKGTKVMIGGAPFLMGALEKELRKQGFTPVYAFSVRDSVEKDGIKTSVFKHKGFVQV